MSRRLLARLSRVDARRRALLDRVAGLDPATLARRPGDEGWSILDVIEHLVLAERDVIGDLDTVDTRPQRRVRLKHHLGYLVVWTILRFGVPVKVPSEGMVPRGGRTLPDLRDQWDDTHARLRTWIASLDAAALHRAPFRHPITGPLTPARAIRLLDVHLRRHEGQIRRLMEGRTR